MTSAEPMGWGAVQFAPPLTETAKAVAAGDDHRASSDADACWIAHARQKLLFAKHGPSRADKQPRRSDCKPLLGQWTSRARRGHSDWLQPQLQAYGARLRSSAQPPGWRCSTPAAPRWLRLTATSANYLASIRHAPISACDDRTITRLPEDEYVTPIQGRPDLHPGLAGVAGKPNTPPNSLSLSKPAYIMPLSLRIHQQGRRLANDEAAIGESETHAGIITGQDAAAVRGQQHARGARRGSTTHIIDHNVGPVMLVPCYACIFGLPQPFGCAGIDPHCDSQDRFASLRVRRAEYGRPESCGRVHRTIHCGNIPEQAPMNKLAGFAGSITIEKTSESSMTPFLIAVPALPPSSVFQGRCQVPA